MLVNEVCVVVVVAVVVALVLVNDLVYCGTVDTL